MSPPSTTGYQSRRRLSVKPKPFLYSTGPPAPVSRGVPMARLGNWSAQRHGWGERNGGRRRQRGWRLQGPLLLARVFSECRVYRSIDLAPALFLGDVHHYGVIGIAGEGLCRPTQPRLSSAFAAAMRA